MHYYSHHIADYQRDTAALTILEHGVYRLLMDACYVTERPLPLEKMERYRICRAMSKIERQAVDDVTARFFQEAADGFHHKRIEAQVTAYQERAVRAAAHGKKGGRPIDPTAPRTFAEAVALETQTLSETKANGKLTINQEPITILRGESVSAGEPPFGDDEGEGEASAEGTGQAEGTLDAATIDRLTKEAESLALLYRRRDCPIPVRLTIFRNLRDGATAAEMRAGITQCTAYITKSPGGFSNRFVPAARNFFANEEWRSPEKFIGLMQQRQAHGRNGQSPPRNPAHQTLHATAGLTASEIGQFTPDQS